MTANYAHELFAGSTIRYSAYTMQRLGATNYATHRVQIMVSPPAAQED